MGNSSNSCKSPRRGQLLDAGLEYASRGWSIIPVSGKRAAGLWKPFQEQPADEATIRRLFANPTVTGLAVVLGKVSGGLAVRDFDLAGAFHAWANANPADAASLPIVQTPRGFHVYGRLDEEAFADLGDGELRADSRHYILLPPSLHPSGQTYTWVNPLPGKCAVLPALPRSLRGQGGEKTKQPKQPIACVPTAAFEAIEATLPSAPGQRNRRVFDLARRLKGIAGLDTSPPMLKAIVAEWHRRALPIIRTKGFGESWTDFQIAWQRVKKPHGSAVQAAYEAARRAPQVAIDGDADLGVLAAMCRNLSLGGRSFYLSCRTVEKLFGATRMDAWRWLQKLQFYEVIEPVQKGTLRGRQATTWRYGGMNG